MFVIGKFNLTTLLLLVIGVILTRFLWGRLRKTQLTVRSMAFSTLDVPPVIVGNMDVNVPVSGDGLYVIGISRTGSTVHIKTLYVGVLSLEILDQRFNRMNKFYDACVDSGASTIVVFSVGTTHKKPFLEQLRVGVASGSMPETTAVLQKYGMKRFLSLEHGCRQPYILIHDSKTRSTLREMTGYCGSNLFTKIRV